MFVVVTAVNINDSLSANHVLCRSLALRLFTENNLAEWHLAESVWRLHSTVTTVLFDQQQIEQNALDSNAGRQLS